MSDDRDRERAQEWAASVYGDSIHAACGEAGYLAGLAAGRAEALVWTSEPPTVAGWYWFRWTKAGLPSVVRFDGEGFYFGGTGQQFRMKGGEYAGPLQLPQEPPR